jgi:uncharacterized protein YjbI with pentapeptide repeats
LVTLFLLATLVATSARAASYQKTRDRIVDPIQYYKGGDHPYTGNNLEPNTNLSGADLTNVELSESDLSYANLTNADLSNAQSLSIMSHATFSFGTTLPDGQTVAEHGFDARPGGLPGGRSCECMGSR